MTDTLYSIFVRWLKAMLRWVLWRVVFPFIVTLLPLLSDGIDAFREVVPYSMLVWWGVGLGVLAVGEILWLIKQGWSRMQVMMWAVLGVLYFSVVVHTLFVLCSKSSLDQLPTFAYTLSGVIWFLSAVVHGCYQSYLVSTDQSRKWTS